MAIHPQHKNDMKWLAWHYFFAVSGLVTWVLIVMSAIYFLPTWAKTFF